MASLLPQQNIPFGDHVPVTMSGLARATLRESSPKHEVHTPAFDQLIQDR